MKISLPCLAAIALTIGKAISAPLPHECAAIVAAATDLENDGELRTFHDLRSLERSDVARHFSPAAWRLLSWKIAESGLARIRIFYVAEETAVAALLTQARRHAPKAWALDHQADTQRAIETRSRGALAWFTGIFRAPTPPPAPAINRALLRAYTLRPFLAFEVEAPDEAIMETRHWDAADGIRHFAFLARAPGKDSALIVGYWTEPDSVR